MSPASKRAGKLEGDRSELGEALSPGPGPWFSWRPGAPVFLTVEGDEDGLGKTKAVGCPSPGSRELCGLGPAVCPAPGTSHQETANPWH